MDMQWQAAIEKVLDDADEPLHYTEIADRIMGAGLRQSVGATPAASVNATISMSLKNDGARSPFERVQRGHYWLRSRQAAQTASVEADVASGLAEDAETGLVQALGMYWRRDEIGWESQRLLGQQHIGAAPVNFWDQRGVYLLYDGRHTVYVGRAIDQPIGRRIQQHTVDRHKDRWDRLSWFGVRGVSEDGELVDVDAATFSLDGLITTMEALLIESLEPPQNRRRGDGFSAVEFIQAADPDLERARQRALLDELLDRT